MTHAPAPPPRPPVRRAWTTGVGALWFILGGCFVNAPVEIEDDVVPDPKQSSVTVLSGGGETDTIGANLSPVILEVRDSLGAPQTAANLRITGSQSSGMPRIGFRLVPDGTAWVEAEATADSDGRLTIYPLLGGLVGNATLRVTEVGTGGSGEATYAVQPGRAVSMLISTAQDPAIGGDRIEIESVAQDRAGNRLHRAPSFEATGQAEVRDGEVYAVDMGQATIVGSLDGLFDSVHVSVLPRGRVAFGTTRDGVSTSRLDGSKEVTWHDGPRVGELDAARVGGSVVIGGSRIQVLTFPAHLARLTGPDADAAFRAEAAPTFGPDGWVYFTALSNDRGANIWRVQTDGTGLEPITPDIAYGDADRHPHADHAGDRLVYVADRDYGDWGPLVVTELEGGSTTSLGVTALAGRWSPDDEWIAYIDIDAHLRRVRPDGADDQVATVDDLVLSSRSFDWSPDGRFIVAVASGTPMLITVETGASVPLSLPFGARSISWFDAPPEVLSAEGR